VVHHVATCRARRVTPAPLRFPISQFYGPLESLGNPQPSCPSFPGHCLEGSTIGLPWLHHRFSRSPDGKPAIENTLPQLFRDAHSPATPCQETILPGLRSPGLPISSDGKNANGRQRFQYRPANARVCGCPKAVCTIDLSAPRCFARAAVVPPLLFGGIVYGLIGLVPEVAVYWKFMLTLVLFNLATATAVLLVSIIFESTSVASLVGTLLMLYK